MSEIRIDLEKCIGCEACVSSCLYGALSMDDGHAVCDPDTCALCGACVDVCPVEAIELIGGKKEKAGKEDYHGVWVYAEQWQGKINDAVFELLSVARGLAADLDEDLSAVLIGNDIDNAEELIRYGAKTVYYLKDERLRVPDDETYGLLLSDLIMEKKPAAVLYAATTFGRSMAPRVAAKLQTGLTADCTKLAIDKERKLLQQTRPAFGGNVMATILCPEHRPQMATVRPRVFKKSLPETDNTGEIITIPARINEQEIKSRILEVLAIVSKEMRVEDAEIVVAGGAGFASKEDFGLVKELADALGGCVGASRAAVDLGYAGHISQVGQTGKVIAPKLYIACGISGAIQHMVGMENSDYIVAINNDPDAPIFQIADVSIVGDVMKVLPQLTASVKAAKVDK